RPGRGSFRRHLPSPHASRLGCSGKTPWVLDSAPSSGIPFGGALLAGAAPAAPAAELPHGPVTKDAQQDPDAVQSGMAGPHAEHEQHDAEGDADAEHHGFKRAHTSGLPMTAAAGKPPCISRLAVREPRAGLFS